METEHFSRLLWACRRGMLELDVLFGNFLKEAFSHLSSSEKNCFIELLNENDQDLFNWLIKKEKARETHFSFIIKKILDHAENRHSV